MRVHKYVFVLSLSANKEPLWSWSYGSWIYNYLCNQLLSPLTLWVRIPRWRGVLDTTLWYKVCQWLAEGQWFSLGTAVSLTNNTYHHDITEMLLKVVLNTITLTLTTDGNRTCKLLWLEAAIRASLGRGGVQLLLSVRPVVCCCVYLNSRE